MNLDEEEVYVQLLISTSLNNLRQKKQFNKSIPLNLYVLVDAVREILLSLSRLPPPISSEIYFFFLN